MTLATTKFTLAEYLSYDDGSENCYELEHGELLLMPFESELNRRIAVFLLIYFSQQGIPASQLTMKTELAVSGASVSVRVPDLMVLSAELATIWAGATRSIILFEMPPPQLVVEVVSPGQKNIDRDYRYKRSECAARGIEEYWVVDPLQSLVTIFQLVNGLYELEEFRGEDCLRSGLFSGLSLTAQQVLVAGC
jgi:Uma2 family endonuclease